MGTHNKTKKSNTIIKTEKEIWRFMAHRQLWSFSAQLKIIMPSANNIHVQQIRQTG